MIKIIYGPKGSGKTKKIIAHANAAVENCKGEIVFITDTLDYSADVKTSIRFVNVSEYGPFNEDMLKGFVSGIIAANSDVKQIYIDGFNRITGLAADDIEDFIIYLERITTLNKFDIFMSASCEKLPASLKQYILK